MKGTVAGLFDGHFTHDHILGMVTITERDNFDLLNYKKKNTRIPSYTCDSL